MVLVMPASQFVLAEGSLEGKPVSFEERQRFPVADGHEGLDPVQFHLGEAVVQDRTHRLAVKMRRADIDTSADANVADGQRVDVTVTPRVILL